jgi:hypothetical protein
MKKKKEIVIFSTEDNECLCHACALVIFKNNNKIPKGKRVTEEKKCDICGYIINR